MTTVTLNLPKKTLAQAQQAANALQRPLEEILADMLTAVLPPVQNAPADMQVELAQMTWLENAELWAIARSMMSEEDQQEIQHLSQEQASRELSANESKKLNQLRQEYGRITLRKARAYALLSLRGGKPLLNQ